MSVVGGDPDDFDHGPEAGDQGDASGARCLLFGGL